MSSLSQIRKRSIQTIRDAFFIDFFFYEPLNFIVEIKTLDNEYNKHFIIHLPQHPVNQGFQLIPFSELDLFSGHKLIEIVRAKKQFPDIDEEDRNSILTHSKSIIDMYIYSAQNKRIDFLKS